MGEHLKKETSSEALAFLVIIIVGLTTYFPTIAEILIARHVTIFTRFIPFFEFTKLGKSWVVFIVALPFALLKGIGWGLVMYGVNILARKFIRLPFWAFLTSFVVFVLLFLAIEGLGMAIVVFMWVAGNAGL